MEMDTLTNYSLNIDIQETLSGELVNINNISEEIFVTLGYNGSGYLNKHYSLNIETRNIRWWVSN